MNKQMKFSSKIAPIVVVGSHGGGTSAIAGILQILGIDMGITEPAKNEDRRMWDFINLKNRIDSRTAGGKMWGWKDPAFITYVDTIMPMLPDDTRFVIVLRSPKAVATSLLRHFPEFATSYLDALTYALMQQKQLLKFSETNLKSFVIDDFDSFRSKPETSINCLSRWLYGLELNTTEATQYVGNGTYTKLGVEQ